MMRALATATLVLLLTGTPAHGQDAPALGSAPRLIGDLLPRPVPSAPPRTLPGLPPFEPGIDPGLITYLQYVAPAPSPPTHELTCRADAVAALLPKVMPRERGPLPDFQPPLDPLIPLATTRSRITNNSRLLSARVQQWNVEHKQVHRLQHAIAAHRVVTEKATVIVELTQQGKRWPRAEEAIYRVQQHADQAPGNAGPRPAAIGPITSPEPLDPRMDAAFRFFDRWRVAAFAVGLQLKDVIPEGEAYCEAGLAYAQCVIERSQFRDGVPIIEASCDGIPIRDIPKPDLLCMGIGKCKTIGGRSTCSAQDRWRGSGCTVDRQADLLPYYIVQRGRLISRSAAIGEGQTFLQSLSVLGTALAGTLQRYEPHARADREGLLPVLVAQEQDLTIERQRLVDERQRLDVNTHTLRDRERALEAARAAEGPAQLRLAALNAQLAVVQQAHDAQAQVTADAEVVASSTRGDLDAAMARLNAAVLDCDEASWEECDNQTAKDRYLERRYAVLEEVRITQLKWTQAVRAFAGANVTLAANALRLATTLSERALAEAESAALAATIVAITEDVAQRTVELETDETEYARLIDGHAFDTRVQQELNATIASGA